MPEATPFDLPFDEAIAHFQAKGMQLSPDGWRDVWQQANARSFTVARVTAMDVLQDIRGEVQKALDSGISLGEFKKNLIPTLQRKGWFAKSLPGTEAQVAAGVKPLTPWRLETIYRTNLQTAYSAGRYQQMLEVAPARPYWQYHAILDSRTRPRHAAMNGKVYDYRHPIWSTWYPPNGFNCRCFVSTLSKRQMAERGLKESTTGVDVQPDEGWRYNVGEAGMDGIDDGRFAPSVVTPGSSGPKTFAEYGRPRMRDVADDLRSPLPERAATMQELLAGGLDENTARASIESEFRSVFGIPAEADGVWLPDYEGMEVRVNMGVLDYLLSKGEGREAYLRYLAATLQDPYEVWLVGEATQSGAEKLRKRYIGLFEKSYLVVLDRYRDGWGVWDAFPVGRSSAADKRRTGELIFGK